MNVTLISSNATEFTATRADGLTAEIYKDPDDTTSDWVLLISGINTFFTFATIEEATAFFAAF